ncbi:MAG TPA: hypothetical protein VFZ61_17090 [Polyangiales bacterium]
MASKRANDNGHAAEYQLGDLQIARAGRVSGEQPAVQTEQHEAKGPAAASTGRGIPRDLTLADGDVGPALELDLDVAPGVRGSLPSAARTSAAAPAARTSLPTSSAQTALESFGDSGFDDFEDGGFAKLPSLEVQPTPARPATRVSTPEEAPQMAVAQERDEYQALVALADFGPAPSGWLASVPYAVRVGKRVLALRSERSLAHEALRGRLGEHHTALVTLGKALVACAEEPRLSPLRAAIAQVRDESTKLQHADQGVSRTREGNERALNLLRSEESHLKEQLAPYLEAEQAALAGQRKLEEELRRAQAMHKRAEIEMRALENATTGVDPGRLSALSLQLAQRKAALDALTPGLVQAGEALGKARRDLALARGGLDANQEKQRKMEADARAREAQAEGEKQAAHGAYETALSELAEAALQQRLGDLAPEQAARVGQTGQAVEQAVGDVARFDRALALYDRSAVRRGIMLVAMVVIGVVAVLVMR